MCGGNNGNQTDLSAALIAVGIIGAVAVIGMGAFLLRRRRHMVQEAAETMYSVQSIIVNSQSNVGNQFLENPIYCKRRTSNRRRTIICAWTTISIRPFRVCTSWPRKCRA